MDGYQRWFMRDEVVAGLNICVYTLLLILTAVVGQLHISYIHAWKKVFTSLLCVGWGLLLITTSIRLNTVLATRKSQGDKFMEYSG